MRLGHNGSIVGLVVLGLVALAVLAVMLYLAGRALRRRYRAARTQHESQARSAADRAVPWTAFSRPNLDQGGRTWLVGVERVSGDGRTLSGPVFVNDDAFGVPADDQSRIWELEAEAGMLAERYTEARAR